MNTLRSFIAMSFCIAFCGLLALAQTTPDKQREAQATNTIAQDALIIIQQEQVRFTGRSAVAEMQLQIFDQAGQLVYDSGAVTGPELTWALRQANGETVKSGLYAYTLSIKDAGAETTRARRGQIIVDRATERDGQSDRLWVTSQNDSGVGAELTVARNEGGTIAGTSARIERNGVKVRDKASDVETGPKSESQTAAQVAATGTVGQLAKFISAGEVGNSVITELNGKVGIGTTNPFRTLQIGPGFDAAFTVEQSDASPNAGYVRFGDRTGWKLHFGRSREFSAGPLNSGTTGLLLTIQDNGNVGIGTSAPQTRLDVVGKTRTNVLEITGGSDFAENFEVNLDKANNGAMTTKVEAGMVVSIDPDSPGKLQLSARPYDRRVAGVISGAGGVNPGMVMSQEGTLADGKRPVALSGRVYCWADATHGAIKPGDLLTTAYTPGHAMKVTNPARAHGAIIGKAMTSLKEGRGLVLVLLTLQ